MIGGRLLVTGIADPLGRAIAARMATRADVEIVIGATRMTGAAADRPRRGRGRSDPGLQRDRRSPPEPGDRHNHPRRPAMVPFGFGRDGTGEHVIATMQLAAAAAHREATVRRVVMVSSTRVYPASAGAPLLHLESEPLQPRRGGLAAALVEAEGFVRDLATENPNLSVSILRFADLAGPDTQDPLARLLASPVAPAVWGFDPPVQLLDVDDAVAAIEHACDHDLAGVFNVAADGLVRWRRAVRLARIPLIELPVAPSGILTTVLRWSYRLDDADDILAVLRYGRRAAIDAFTRSGFQPTRTTEQCVRRPPDRVPPDGARLRAGPTPRRHPPNSPPAMLGSGDPSSPITAIGGEPPTTTAHALSVEDLTSTYLPGIVTRPPPNGAASATSLHDACRVGEWFGDVHQPTVSSLGDTEMPIGRVAAGRERRSRRPRCVFARRRPIPAKNFPPGTARSDRCEQCLVPDARTVLRWCRRSAPGQLEAGDPGLPGPRVRRCSGRPGSTR